MELRRLGRLEHMSSVLIYGGAALAEVSQEVADDSISLALESGINHFDTAAGYGDSELRLAPWMPEIRDRIFLSSKTDQRPHDAAKRQIHASIERLSVDHLDLIQVHAVNDENDLDAATAPEGALEACIEARDEGIVKAIGITGHGMDAPATHRRAFERFDFDTVLTPLNYLLYNDPGYRAGYDALVSEVQVRDSALMLIKHITKNLWPEKQQQRYATWYEPLTDQDHIDAAIAFALRRKEITGIPTAGDVRLLPKLVEAERRASEISDEDIARVMAQVPDYASPFVATSGRVGPL